MDAPHLRNGIGCAKVWVLKPRKAGESVMSKVTTIGLDLAKNVFQVHGADEQGKRVYTKRLKRGQVLEFFAQHPIARVGMEACGGAYDWARRIEALGHEVKLMAPQHVKPYVIGNKTDARDARGIAEAAARASVPALALRSEESQQCTVLHTVRSQWMKQRIACANEMRGLLAEFGEIVPKGMKQFRAHVNAALERLRPRLPLFAGVLDDMLEQLRKFEENIAKLEGQIKQLHVNSPASRLIEGICGVGVLSATAVVARYGGCENFDSSRKFASAIGLTPKEHSSGDKQMRLGISKRGDPYVRYLLIHGARSVLKVRMNNPAYQDDWVVRVARRRGVNIAVVALAAKNARRIWAMLRTGELFDPNHGKALVPA